VLVSKLAVRQLAFEHVVSQVRFAEYLAEVTAAGERIKRLEAGLRQCATTSREVVVIRALQALRGIGFLSAVTILASVAKRTICVVSARHRSGGLCQGGSIGAVPR
jgi:transposase